MLKRILAIVWLCLMTAAFVTALSAEAGDAAETLLGVDGQRIDGEYGDSLSQNESSETVDSPSEEQPASMIGEGSLILIVSFVVLIASVASILVNVAAIGKKRK